MNNEKLQQDNQQINGLDVQAVQQANVDKEIQALMDKYYQFGLIEGKKIKGIDARAYVKFSLALSRVMLSGLRGVLLLAQGFRQLDNSLPIIGAGLTLFGLVFALITLDYAGLTRTGIFNTVGLSIDALLNLFSDLGTAIAAFLPSMAQLFEWLPILGFVSSGLMIAMEIINIGLVEKKHSEKLKEFGFFADELATNSNEPDKNWLQDTSKLTLKQKLLKTALKQKISLDEVLEHKSAIRALFTKNEFDAFKNQLIAHQINERNKIILRHVLTLNIGILVAVASIIGALVPGLAVAMALAGIGIVIAAFVTKLVLYETILKGKTRISVNEFISNLGHQEELIDQVSSENTHQISEDVTIESCNEHIVNCKSVAEDSDTELSNIVSETQGLESNPLPAEQAILVQDTKIFQPVRFISNSATLIDSEVPTNLSEDRSGVAINHHG